MENTLEIKGLEVSVKTEGNSVRILGGINLEIERNESVALVGESGSGKTMTAMSVMQLLPKNISADRGEILLQGRNILAMNEKELREMRGTAAGMIFQEPSSYLNPLFTVGSQIAEAVKEEKGNRKEKVMRILKDVELKSSAYYQYPHQLSGGMQQRVMIAMALINNPALLIADEPTTALDATTAYGIIELLKKMMAKYGLSVLFITHDISLAASFAKRIGVMYAGRLVEISDAGKIIDKPLHPYAERLIDCLPERYNKGERIKTIEGSVPDFKKLPRGCPFHPRCSYKKEVCTQKEPGEMNVEGRIVRCFRYGNLSENG
ncbi:MAG TPA: ABC transporter ATP-binding protein [bacterium]|nr:ABC transporter ATP-binding protein [bacterium]